MRTKNPFQHDAEDMAQEFIRLAAERAAEYEAEEDALDHDDQSTEEDDR